MGRVHRRRSKFTSASLGPRLLALLCLEVTQHGADWPVQRWPLALAAGAKCACALNSEWRRAEGRGAGALNSERSLSVALFVRDLSAVRALEWGRAAEARSLVAQCTMAHVGARAVTMPLVSAADAGQPSSRCATRARATICANPRPMRRYATQRNATQRDATHCTRAAAAAAELARSTKFNQLARAH